MNKACVLSRSAISSFVSYGKPWGGLDARWTLTGPALRSADWPDKRCTNPVGCVDLDRPTTTGIRSRQVTVVRVTAGCRGEGSAHEEAALGGRVNPVCRRAAVGACHGRVQ